MNKAVFIDRDGVINSDEGHYYIYNTTDFKLNPGIIENLKVLKDAGYLIIIISNQSGISKGIYTKDNVDEIHKMLIQNTSSKGLEIDEIYYCPHHSEIENCLCRKPKPLMIEKAIARFNIDIRKSFFIGDSKRDIEAANNAGVEGILVPKNSNIYEICKSILMKL